MPRNALSIALVALCASAAFALGFWRAGGAMEPNPATPAANPAPDRSPINMALPQPTQSQVAPGHADRQRSLTEAFASNSLIDQSLQLFSLARDATASTVIDLLDEAAGLDRQSQRQAARYALYLRYAELDPDAALAHVLAHGDGQNDVAIVFQVWARADVDRALDAASRLPGQLSAVAGMAIVRARDDLPPAALSDYSALLQLPGARQATALQRDYLFQARGDVEAAFDRALRDTENDRHLRRMALMPIANAWGRSDPLAAMARAEELGDRELRMTMQHAVARAWASYAPYDAFDWARSQPNPAPGAAVPVPLDSVLSTIADSDPQLALELASGLSAPQHRNGAVAVVLRTWGMREPAAAAVHLFDVTDARARMSALSVIASAYVRGDPEGAMHWALSLPDADARPIVNLIAGQLAQQDPARAAQFVTQVRAAATQAEAARVVGSNWAGNAPEDAARWAGTLRNADARGAALSGVLMRWAMSDADAALRHLRQLSGSQEYDAMIPMLLPALLDDPAAAEAAIAAMRDTEARSRARQQLEQIQNLRSMRSQGASWGEVITVITADAPPE
jgi:hypothetical protein